MSWENYDDVLEQLRDAGLLVDHLEVGSHRPVRVRIEGDREKRGWYWLSEIELETKDGGRGRFIVGSYGIWRGNDNGAIKVRLPRRGGRRLSEDEKRAIAARHRANAKRAAAMREAEAERAAAAAAHAWSHYVEEGESPYLARKRVGAHGVRFSPSGNGTLAVPMRDANGRVWGLQIIRGARPKGKLEKEYWPKGLAKQGRSHIIGAISPGGVVLLAEGYATAATLHESTGLPVVVAFDAGNLLPVAEVVAKTWRGARILACADDDYLQKCRACGKRMPVADERCAHCGEPHGQTNPGVAAAERAALAVDGRVVVPEFPFDRDGRKLTDFNDLFCGLIERGADEVQARRAVGQQIERALEAAGWMSAPDGAPRGGQLQGSGERPGAVSILPLDDAVERYLPIDDGTGKTLFDSWSHRLVQREQMLSVLPAGVRWDDVKRHPTWISRGAYFIDEIGFDPAGTDPKCKLNLFTGWEMTPKAGECTTILDLLSFLTSGDPNGRALYAWILKWLAYPLQHPGAKMRSALVVHGPQGTGKSLFFEIVAKIYGEYGIVINQGTIEDKFNADWVSRKLFVVADEIVARAEMYHLKNQLKGLITGETVRVNPKNLAAHTEANHMNLVFLSNEQQPLVLEHDDRRHCVVWTPGKLPKSAYTKVSEEADNGGVEALYHYLLNLDLGDFKPWTEPPMTRAKRELIDLSRDSVEQFIDEWRDGDLDVPFCPCKSAHLYQVYQRWCRVVGERFPRSAKQMMAHIDKREGWFRGHKSIYETAHYNGSLKRARVVVPSDSELAAAALVPDARDWRRPDGEPESHWLTDGVLAFERAMSDWEGAI